MSPNNLFALFFGKKRQLLLSFIEYTFLLCAAEQFLAERLLKNVVSCSNKIKKKKQKKKKKKKKEKEKKKINDILIFFFVENFLRKIWRQRFPWGETF